MSNSGTSPPERASLRLFFAVELPADVQHALGRLRPSSAASAADYRWVNPDLLHVTLAFLGQQPRETLPRLSALATAAAAASQPGRLRLGDPGSFGPPRAPRVLWVGLAGDLEPLLALQSRLADALRTTGFALEDRPFQPHITLARRREGTASGRPPPWPPASGVPGLNVPLRHLTLFQSRLSQSGPAYIALERFPLASD